MKIMATDENFKNIWKDNPGLIIGRGTGDEYKDYNLDDFNGKIIGCNTAYRMNRCDATVLMDEKVFFDNKDDFDVLTNYQDHLLFIINPIYPLYGCKVISLDASKPDRCSISFNSGFYPCNLSGYVALNVALLLGLNPIWLVGFNPNDAVNTKVIERSKSFKLIADWCKNNNRKVFLASKEENNLLNDYFIYKPLPIKIKKNKKLKEMEKDELAQGI